MSKDPQSVVNSRAIRDDFVPKDDYFSPAFEASEAEYLWLRVWQIACREEEVSATGDFVTYDIIDDSIVVVRTERGIAAYHNVCPHRGRRLTDGCGHLGNFTCRFHGWQWSLNGENKLVVDEADWGGALSKDDIHLGIVRAETWGGFVWINMDLEAEPLVDFLAPVIERCDRFEFDKLRFRWYRTVVLPVNWKVALEAFDEGYHVGQTHAQLLPYIEDYSKSMEYGPHGAFWVSMEKAATIYPLQPSARLGGPPANADFRKYVLDFVHEFNFELRAMVTPRTYEATQRLRDELSADASQDQVLEAWMRFQKEAAESEGAGWPKELTPEYVQASHVDWHVFPNTIYLHSSIDGVLWYRSRPNGHDTNSCLFDVWSLQRYAPGAEPPIEREFYNDWREADWGRILTQDFLNLPAVHKGMKSRWFKGSRTNPVQERVTMNFHRALHRFIEGGMGLHNSRAEAAILSPIKRDA
jgi:phenylpropionate dioxygenase-like ring-hydroxylating dioxygenase large terminal subunit